MTIEESEDLCKACLPIVRRASEFIKSEIGNVSANEIEAKEKNSLVSYVDKTAEEIIIKGIGQLLPDAEYLTEEATVAQNEGDLRWIIDPLDGTTNFLHSVPHFSVSLALEFKGKLVFGIVEEVNSQETFYAWKGGGAYCNGNSIRVTSNNAISESIAGTGFPYVVGDSAPMMALLDHWIKHGRGVRRMGSAALDLAYVACGRYDFYYETSINSWDIAGGAIIVEEAGGKVTDLWGRGQYIHAGHIIASNGHLHQEIIDQVVVHFGRDSSN